VDATCYLDFTSELGEFEEAVFSNAR
jgi:hypothetical protein